MKYVSLILILGLFSCANKEDILLPVCGVSVVTDVRDHSPIYIFFRSKKGDTLAETNRKNEIISTNWIFNIDKRLPLKLVIPEVMKLQMKKRTDTAHKNEAAQNYYSYADSIVKNLAFLPFTDVYYELKKPLGQGLMIFFKKGGKIFINDKEAAKEAVAGLENRNVIICFDKEMGYEEYLRNKIFIRTAFFYDLRPSKKEFIY